jgi:predicted AAA+ superfamily ATPase
MSTLPRKIEGKIKDALKISPIVFLNGPRQSGKSTLVQSIASKIEYLGKPATYHTFDRPTEMAAASSAPELFRPLKVVVDELRLNNKENANGKYLLTGSANILALPKLADPLVGRMSVLTLYPFCISEVIISQGNALERLFKMDFENMEDRGLSSLTHMIKLATYPEISNKAPDERSIWFDGYLTTMLQRDVKQLAHLDKISSLPSLLRILATRAGRLINDADISRELGLNSVTGKSYRNILKMMFLNFDVPPWYKNVGKRLVKASKGFLIDTLMLCHMLEWDIDEIEKNKPDLFGHILENFVATELTKLLTFSSIKAQLLHFRTSDGIEVDFVLERSDGSIFAIEVKKSENVTGSDFKGIKQLAELAPNEFIGGIVLYTGKQVVPFGKNLWAVPFHLLWQ